MKSITIYEDVSKALVIGVIVCMLRVAIFDGPTYFLDTGIPNHDSLSAIIGFASSLHSMRLEGDIAWWIPSTQGGDAYYYNFFLSPLAPTAGNPIFLIWAKLVQALSWFGYSFSEYRQFLIFDFILLPILTYSAFVLLLRRVCAGWLAPILGLVAYAFSGIAIWNNAWMFYQEWFCLLFFLWSLDLFVSYPSRKTMALLGMAMVNYASSFNYWTLFSLWILIAAVGLHLYLFKEQWRKCFVLFLAKSLTSSRVVLIMLSLIAVACTLNLLTVGLVYKEQSPNHVRVKQDGFSLDDVYGRAQKADVRFFSTELFNPIIDRPLERYKVVNNAHNARYLGVVFLPLLVCFIFIPWQRKDNILFILLTFTTAVVTTSGLMILLWKITPGMSTQRHIFYFYQYFFQILIILIGCRTFDFLISSCHPYKKQIKTVIYFSMGFSMFIFAAIFWFADTWHPPVPGVSGQDPTLKSIGFFAILLLVVSVLLYRIQVGPRRWTTLYSWLLLFIVTGDLMHYYWRASLLDQKFTLTYRNISLVDGKLPPTLQAALNRPWAGSNTQDLFENLPIRTDFWPENNWNSSPSVLKFQNLSTSDQAKLTGHGTLSMAKDVIPTNDGEIAIFNANEEIKIRPIDWSYNSETSEFTVSRSGTIVTSQNYDSAWKVTVDGKDVKTRLVNIRMLAFDAEVGTHLLKMEYRPLSRMMFHISSGVTLFTLGLLFVAYLTTGRKVRVPSEFCSKALGRPSI